jgi:hypothetical protein
MFTSVISILLTLSTVAAFTPSPLLKSKASTLSMGFEKVLIAYS